MAEKVETFAYIDEHNPRNIVLRVMLLGSIGLRQQILDELGVPKAPFVEKVCNGCQWAGEQLDGPRVIESQSVRGRADLLPHTPEEEIIGRLYTLNCIGLEQENIDTAQCSHQVGNRVIAMEITI